MNTGTLRLETTTILLAICIKIGIPRSRQEDQLL